MARINRRKQGRREPLPPDRALEMAMVPDAEYSSSEIEAFRQRIAPEWFERWLADHDAWAKRPDKEETHRQFHERLKKGK